MKPPKSVLECVSKLQQVPGLKHRILPPKHLASIRHNGAGGAYIPYINKVTLCYQPMTLYSGGTSEGLVHFIRHQLPTFAARHPHVEFSVQQSYHRIPHLTALYYNGQERTEIVRKSSAQEVKKVLQQLVDGSGMPRQQRYRPVTHATGHQAVLPAWDPFHAEKMFKP